ncbi:MAG: hypothetical protein AAB348_02470 [Patescibacteria group bacterium]
MQTNKIILVFSGLMASGKDTAALYLKAAHRASIYSFSTMLEDALRRFHLEFNRDNLIKMSEIIRGSFGEDIMAKTMAKDVENDPNNLIVVSNARRMADVEYLSKFPNYVLCELFADPKVRYDRIVNRGQRVDDKTKTFEQFMADHQRTTELSILDVVKNATEHIDNNGSLEEFHKKLDALVKKYNYRG